MEGAEPGGGARGGRPAALRPPSAARSRDAAPAPLPRSRAVPAVVVARAQQGSDVQLQLRQRAAAALPSCTAPALPRSFPSPCPTMKAGASRIHLAPLQSITEAATEAAGSSSNSDLASHHPAPPIY